MSRRSLLLACGLAGLAALCYRAPALAHALLVRSTPESNAELLTPPGSVDMWFSEPLETVFTDARLVGPDGQDVETGAAIVDPADPTHVTLALASLDPGIYTVAWQTLSQVDGHEWFGSFPFTVLNPDGSRPAAGAAVGISGGRGDLPSPGEAVGRWLALAPAMLIAGGTFFQLVIVEDRRGTALSHRARRNLTRLIWLAAAALVVGTLLTVLLQAQRLGGLSTLPRLTLNTRTGLLGLVRIMFAAIAGLAATELLRESDAARTLRVIVPLACYLLIVPLAASDSQSLAALWLVAALLALLPLAVFFRPDRRQRGYQSLLIGSLALLFSFSSSSHAGAAQGSVYAVAADFMHLAAAAIWFSGIVLLALLWLQARRELPGDDFLRAVRRFSTVAGAAVFVIVLTGLFSSLVELPTFESLWTTSYGQVLLAKLGLVAAALGVAYLNNRRVRHRKGTEQLPRQITIEAAISVGIVLVVAFLVQTPTPRSVSTEAQAPAVRLPFNNLTPVDDLNLHIQVDPNQAGENRFWVHLYRDDGSDIGEVQLVRLFIEHQERQLGRSSADLQPLGQNTFAEQGSYLSQPGQWEIQVYVRRRGVDDILSPVQFEVPPAASSVTYDSPLGNPVPGIPPLALVGGLSFALGLVPFLWPGFLASRLPRALPTAGAVLIAAGMFGVVRGVTGITAAEVPLIERTNPIPPTAQSIARGQQIYQQSCLICHGVTGKGDGPVGVTLSPRPSDFAIHMPPGIHTDGQLLEWISNGFPSTAMPAFGEGYSEDELWDVINYIRTFAPSDDG